MRCRPIRWDSSTHTAASDSSGLAGITHALVSGSVPNGYAAHLTHLLDEAPVPLVVMAVEEAAANEGVSPKAVWRNLGKLARALAVHRQGLWS